jgi:hypothetical protein
VAPASLSTVIFASVLGVAWIASDVPPGGNRAPQFFSGVLTTSHFVHLTSLVWCPLNSRGTSVYNTPLLGPGKFG